MSNRELLIHILDLVEGGNDVEPGQLLYWGYLRSYETEDKAIQKQDKRFIEHGTVFSKWYTTDYLVIDNKSPWWERIADIVAGAYALDKLPEHIRKTARELYYA